MSEPGRVTTWTNEGVRDLLLSNAMEPGAVEYVGSGHWSDCFGFVSDGRELVIRVGDQVEDFRKDERARSFTSPGLPVPDVLAVGECGNQFYAISERAFGTPLEQVAAPTAELNLGIVDLLEGLRLADLSGTTGWGLWTSADGAGAATGWRDFLLGIDRDEPRSRVHGWSTTLAAWPTAQSVFDRYYDLLAEVATDDVPRSLIHNDLYHRNVHATGDSITGVFDWGNSLFGDHLYDLAMLCFWSPWFDHLDERPVLDELHRRWAALGTSPSNFDERFLTCMLHMGLEHIAYHAFLNNKDEARRVCDRIEAVVDMSWR